jgi:FkbM family methyltransferase
MTSAVLQRVVARDATRRLTDRGAQPALPLRLTAEHAEDAFLIDLFDDRPTGYFIEAGALDGIRYSNTYALEALGWTGLLVEPIPELAERCAANRPNSRVERVALSAPGHAPTATLNRYTDDDQVGASRLDDDANRHARAKRGAATEPIDVPLATLDSLLDGVDRVDLLVLDIEGHELQALRGFSLDCFKPRVILVEDHALGDDDSLARYLADHAYEHCGWIAWNRICVRQDEPDLIGRARALLGTR